MIKNKKYVPSTSTNTIKLTDFQGLEIISGGDGEGFFMSKSIYLKLVSSP